MRHSARSITNCRRVRGNSAARAGDPTVECSVVVRKRKAVLMGVPAGKDQRTTRWQALAPPPPSADLTDAVDSNKVRKRRKAPPPPPPRMAFLQGVAAVRFISPKNSTV